MPVTKRTVLLNEPSISLASDVADTGMKNDKSSKENAKDKEKESEDFTRISTVAMIHHYPTSTDERNDESGAVKHEFQSSISSIFPSSSGVQKDLIVSYQPRTLRNTASSKFVKNKKGLSKFHTSTPLPGHIKRAFLCPPKEIDFEEISVYREPCKNKKCKSRPENECRVPRGRNKTKKSVKSTAINSSHTPKPTRSNPNLPKDVKCLENPTDEKNERVSFLSSNTSGNSNNGKKYSTVINSSYSWKVVLKDYSSVHSSRFGKKRTLRNMAKPTKKSNENGDGSFSISRKTDSTQKVSLAEEIDILVEKAKTLPCNVEVGKKGGSPNTVTAAKKVNEKENKYPSIPTKTVSAKKLQFAEKGDQLIERDERLTCNAKFDKESGLPRTTKRVNKNSSIPTKIVSAQKVQLPEEEKDQLIEEGGRLLCNGEVGKGNLPSTPPGAQKANNENESSSVPTKTVSSPQLPEKDYLLMSKDKRLPYTVEVCSRRSKRKRMKPLEYWKGEKLIFKIGADNCREVVGIECGQSEEKYVVNNNTAPKQKKRALKPSKLKQEEPHEERNIKIAMKKRRTEFPLSVASKLQKRELITIPYKGKDHEIECFSTLRSDNNLTEVERSDVAVYSGIENHGMEAGYLQISPKGEIIDSASNGSVVFHVLSGLCSATINGKTKTMRKGDIIFVPKDLEYKISNDKFETVLSYTRFDTI